jgi:8-oxo-dGTP pyrophosphatase MutT (NUDIX family)
MLRLPSQFLHPPIDISEDLLIEHFLTDYALTRSPLRNPHMETPVSDEVKASASASAVLIVFIQEDEQLKVLVTKRSANIRFGGHICFPGGKVDDNDKNPVATALREAQEEIGLEPDKVTILGSMGDYFTQTAYRITPVVGIVQQPFSIGKDLTPCDSEVEKIYALPASLLFASSAYDLHQLGTASQQTRGHYSLSYGEAGSSLRVSGPTVSMMMGLYEELLKSRGLLHMDSQN